MTTVRSADDSDFPWILELIDDNRGESLTERERAQNGFVQGQWDEGRLRDFSSTGPGFALAEVDGHRAGIALSSPPGAAGTGPAGELNQVARERFGPNAYFMYGPVVVSSDFRGRGVLSALTNGIFELARGTYPRGVAFIESSNERSLAVHDHLGWERFAEYEVGASTFYALSRTV